MAGGQSRRFGSDKALALHNGTPLIQHVARALHAQCDAVVVCGPERNGWQAANIPHLPDFPAPGLGPMGGICAALHHARISGFDLVLSCPCDVPDLPENTAKHLLPAPAVADGQWLIGLWPAVFSEKLAKLLNEEGAISARRWAEFSHAMHKILPPMRNINRPEDIGLNKRG